MTAAIIVIDQNPEFNYLNKSLINYFGILLNVVFDIVEMYAYQ